MVLMGRRDCGLRDRGQFRDRCKGYEVRYLVQHSARTQESTQDRQSG